jgi:hypothetical protein
MLTVGVAGCGGAVAVTGVGQLIGGGWAQMCRSAGNAFQGRNR